MYEARSPRIRIIVDLSDRRLYVLEVDKVVESYPVGIGAMVSKTPIGDYKVKNKAPNPGGPYGAYWLGLTKPGYGIHGTNDPSSIGKMVSKGCIRMQNADVKKLAARIPIGTRVSIRP